MLEKMYNILYTFANYYYLVKQRMFNVIFTNQIISYEKIE